MNCLAPLTTHSPSTSSALVRVAPASEPAPGSVRPKPASARPATRSGSHCSFCSSVPKVRIGLMPSPTRRLEGDAHRLVDPADLLDRDAEAGEVAVLARAAVLLRRGQADQPELAHLLHHVDREVVVAVPLRGVRRDLGLGELADQRAELLVLGGQLEQGWPFVVAEDRPTVLDAYVNVKHDGRCDNPVQAPSAAAAPTPVGRRCPDLDDHRAGRGVRRHPAHPAALRGPRPDHPRAPRHARGSSTPATGPGCT